MKKSFLTYLPLWFPMQSRQRLLWRDLRPVTAISWFRILTGISENEYQARVSGTPQDKELRAWFIFAYARDSKNAFAVDDLEWQFAWAKHMDAMLQKQIKSPYYLRADMKSIYELFHLEFHVTGIHKKSRRLHFNWIEIVGTIDTTLLWSFVEEYFDHVTSVYMKRWKDPRYAFATEESCPVPVCEEDIIRMNPFYMGLLLDVIFFRLVSRWQWSSCRSCSFWSISHKAYMSEARPDIITDDDKAIVKTLLLKPALSENAINGPYTDRIQALAVRATNGTVGRRILYSRLPATVIEQMDNLVEEMCNASQHQRQQGQVCESAASPDGTSTN